MTLEEALNHFDNSNTKLAEAIGIDPAAVSNWKKRGGVIPTDSQCRLQVVTKGKLKADEIPKKTA